MIIPALNAGSFLTEAIRSLLDQNYPRLEIFLIDDASTDNTPAIAAEFGTALNYERSIFGSPSAARNAGIRKCEADFVGFLDADDQWSPNRLHAQLAFHAQHPELDYSHGYTRKVFLTSHLDSRPHYPRDDAAHLNPNPGSILFRRQALLRLGGFDEDLRYGEDIDFWLRSRSSGLNGAVFEQVVLLYRMHAENMTNFQASEHSDLLTVLYRSILRQGRHPMFSPANARLPHLTDNHRSFPLVSVIVYAPAPAVHLKETLDSIENQGYPDLEVILVGDQTPGFINTEGILSGNRQANITYVQSKETGFAQAFNLGWKVASGEYLACMKAGDVWSGDRLRCQAGVLLYNTHASLVLGDIRLVIDPLRNPSGGSSQYSIPPGDHLGAALVRQQAGELVGKMDTSFEDGAAAEWLSRFSGSPVRLKYPLIARIPRVVLYQPAENRSYFNVREWPQSNLTRIVRQAIQRHREQVL